MTVINTTSFTRNETLYLDYVPGMRVQGGYAQQVVDTLQNGRKLAVAGVELPPYGSVVLTLEPGEPEARSLRLCSGRPGPDHSLCQGCL